MRWRWLRSNAGPEAAAPAGPAGAGDAAEAPDQDPANGAGPVFVGRHEQQARFTELMTAVAAGPGGDRAVLLQVVGPGGTGKRALLDRLAAICAEREWRHGPVLDVAEVVESSRDELLERIAHTLEPVPERFEKFYGRVHGMRARMSGQPSVAARTLGGTRAATAGAREVAPGLVTGVANVVAQNPLMDIAVERGEARRTIEEVQKVFMEGLAELARERPERVALLFSDLHLRPDEPNVRWLRRWLFPKLARMRVLLVLSAETEHKLADVAAMFSDRHLVRLDRLSDDEAMEFVVLAVGLAQDAPLARALVRDSDRFPERLARFSDWFRDHPDALGDDEVPPGAKVWAVGGSAAELLGRVDSPFLRDLVLCASPLRWFNAELLTRIAVVCEIAPEDPSERAASLVEHERRPSWVTPVEGGWAVSDGSDLDALRREFRRRTPGRAAAVHREAAQYHAEWMRAWERRQDEATDAGDPGGDAFDYRPILLSERRFADEDYEAALMEWVYHLVALAPERGFDILLDHVAEAMVEEEPRRALRLLDSVSGLRLPKTQALYRQRIGDIARALDGARHAEAMELLGELTRAGAPNRRMAATTEFLMGQRGMQIGQAAVTVLPQFERAEAILAGLDDDDAHGRLLRFWNLTWLGWIGALSGRPRGVVMPQLEAAAAIAEARGAPELQAEAARVQALALNHLGDRAAAGRMMDEGLAIARAARSPDTTARILCDRADLRRQAAGGLAEGERGRALDEAAGDLRRARSIYAQLEDRGAEASVLVSLVAIALAQGDQDAARVLRDEAVGLRPADPFVCNQVGLAYQEAAFAAADSEVSTALFDEAERHYGDAFTLSEEAVFLLNRAFVRGQRHDEDGRRTDLEEAGQRDPGNLDIAIALAQARRDQGDGALAEEAARAAADQILRLAPEGGDEVDRGDDDADPDDGGAAGESPLRTNLMAVLPLLAPADAAEVLASWTEVFPEDAEGHLLLGLARRASPSPVWAFGPDLGPAEEATARAASLAEARSDDALRARCLTELADLYARLGRSEEAEEAARIASELAPNSAAADEIVSRLQRMRGRSDAIIEPDDYERFVPPIAIEISEELGRWVHPDQSPEGQEFFATMIDEARDAMREAWGVSIPGLRFRFAPDAAPGFVRILLFEAPRRRFDLGSDFLAGASPADCRAAAGADGAAAVRPWDGGPGTWVGEAEAGALREAGVPVWDPRGVILAALTQVIRERGPFVALDELASMVASQGNAAEEEALWVAGALRGLLAEGVSLARLPEVVEVVRGHADRPPAELAERVRAALGPGAEPADIPAERVAIATAAGADERRGDALRVALAPDDADLADDLEGRPCPAAETWTALGVREPALAAAVDDALEAGEVVISVAGVPRVVASPTSPEDWARRHPLSGARGRSGGLAPLPSGEAPIPTGELAARLLEEVVADDPGLVLGEASVAEAIRSAVRELEGDDAAWLEVLRELATRRVPLGSTDEVVDGLEAAAALHRRALAAAPAPVGGPVALGESSPQRPIPDATAIGVVDTIVLRAEGEVATIRVAAEITHTYPTELRARLAGPSGVAVDLVPDVGMDLRAFRRGLDPETCPALSACVGEPAGGPWTLHVRDETASDTGTLFRWSIEITTTAAPEPPDLQEGVARGEAPRAPGRARVARRHASQVEHLAQRLQPQPSIVLALGDELWGEMVDAADEERPRCDALAMAAEAFFEARAVLLASAMLPERDEGLAPRGYAIRVNGIPRGAGEVPSGRRFVPGWDGDGARGALPALDGGRVAALPGAWVPIASDDPDSPEGLEPETWIASHVVACLAEATRELADLDWCRRFLDRLAVTSPLTVAAVREALGEEVVAGALARLADDGVRLRDLRLLEYMLELGADPEAGPGLDAARPLEAGDEELVTPAALACFLRLRVGHPVVDGPIEAVEVSPGLEGWLRARLRESDRWRPVYDLPEAEALLRAFRDAFRGRDDERTALVTSSDLGRHLRRLLAVQLPRVRVLARETIDGAAVTTVATVDPPDGLPGG